MGSLLISVAVISRAASIVTNLPIVGGILACGIILLITSLLGLAGAIRHHQVLLFFVSFYQKCFFPPASHSQCQSIFLNPRALYST